MPWLRRKSKPELLITILGCGTSVGVPMIGMHHLPQFRRARNRRLRASCLIEVGGRGGPAILIDTSPDLREQALRYFPRKNPRLDAVLLTHSHADHLHGLDDVRPFNFLQKSSIPLYSDPQTLEDVRVKFSYIFQPTQEGGGKPRIELHPVGAATFMAAGLEIQPLTLEHGAIPVLGFRIGRFAYLTDLSRIPEAALAKLADLDVLVLDCLRPKPHTTHLNMEQSLDYARRIGAKRTIFTHMSWELDYYKLRKALPRGMEPAYDGLQISLGKLGEKT